MKTIFGIFAAIVLFSFTSCKKEYMCECTVTSQGVSATESESIKGTKKKAKEACEAGSTSTTSGGVTTTTTCVIK